MSEPDVFNTYLPHYLNEVEDSRTAVLILQENLPMRRICIVWPVLNFEWVAPEGFPEEEDYEAIWWWLWKGLLIDYHLIATLAKVSFNEAIETMDILCRLKLIMPNNTLPLCVRYFLEKYGDKYIIPEKPMENNYGEGDKEGEVL